MKKLTVLAIACLSSLCLFGCPKKAAEKKDDPATATKPLEATKPDDKAAKPDEAAKPDDKAAKPDDKK
jgi:outer membrane murein-binding lipoprotein Lpp